MLLEIFPILSGPQLIKLYHITHIFKDINQDSHPNKLTFILHRILRNLVKIRLFLHDIQLYIPSNDHRDWTTEPLKLVRTV